MRLAHGAITARTRLIITLVLLVSDLAVGPGNSDILMIQPPVTKSISHRVNVIPAHVELGDGHSDVVHGQPPLQEEVLAHVSQGRRRVNGVPADSVPLEIGRSVTALQISRRQKNIYRNIFLEIINLGQFVSIKLKDTEMHIKCVNKSFSLLAGTLDCSASVLQGIKTDQKYFK